MNKPFLIFLSVFFFFSVYGVEEYTEPQEVATTEGLPSSLVNQSVCAISGEYTDSAVDVVVPGPEPLVMSRVYTSLSRGRGWSFNHNDQLILGYAVYKDVPLYRVVFRQPSSAELDYVCQRKEGLEKQKKVTLKLLVPKGLTNGASALSGKTNIRNQTLYWYPQAERIIACSGAGNRKVFKRSGKTAEGLPICSQLYEEKVNGSRIRYPGKGFIVCENKENKTLYSAAKFSEKSLGKEHYIRTLITSDKRKLSYFFKRYHFHIKQKEKHAETSHHIDHFYLSQVKHPYAPHETYTYAEKSLGGDANLIEKTRDEGRRFLRIEYYQKGENCVGGVVGEIDIKEEDDFRLDRVKKLRAPVGHDRTAITTHRFDYHAHIKKRDDYKKVAEGYTDVYDAKDHKTRYTYDEDHRLTSIIRYSGTNPSTYAPYTQESFLWNEEGYLIAKMFKDGTDHLHHARLFTYDTHGNVLTSTLCGKLTGKPSPPLLLSSKGTLVENGYERETKHYTYSQDGLNLLLSETDTTGKTIRYVYKTNRDILKAKYTSYEGKIRLREFFFYDSNNALAQKILDDGCQEPYEDLSFANERHQTLFIPRTEAPVGLPESVEECAYDFFNQKNIPLKHTTHHYSPQGHLLDSQVFDAEGYLAHTLHWTYDLHGNLTSETNALGETLTRTYDLATDNLLTQSSIDVTLLNTYDFANRLIEKRESHPDYAYVTSQRFDTLGNCKTITNFQGHTTHHVFDDLGRIIEIHHPEIPKEGRLTTPIEKITYDIAGFPITLTNANGETTHIEVNIRGQPTHILYPDGTQEEKIYSVEGRLMQTKAKNGTRTKYTRDPLGRITQEKTYGKKRIKQTTHRYNAFHLIESIDPEGNRTTYTYDWAGRLKETIQNEQRTEQFYDPLGRLSEIREYYDHEPHAYRATLKTYDPLDRLIEETLQNAQGETLHLSRYAYDIRGNRTLLQTGHQKTHTEYNTRNQPIKITNALDHSTHIDYQTDFINPYGQRVLQKTTTDPLGYQTKETYDAAQRLAEVIRLNPFGEKIARQTYAYDLIGNQTQREEEVIEESKVTQILVTHHTYNPAQQITHIIEASGTPEQKITHIHYNAFGQKETLIKPDGKEIHYTYDSFNRLKTQTTSDNTLAYRYTYNLLDQATHILDQTTGQATTREYQQGKLKKETLSNGLSIEFTYDRTGRAQTLYFPDQTGVEYLYNAVDLKEIYRLIQGQRTYVHQENEHSLSGQITKAKPPGNNGIISYQFDPLDRCISIESNTFCQHIPPHGFDPAGNLIQCETQNIPYSFTYDDHYHLTAETGHSTQTYTFDSLSNRTSKNREKHHINALNQLVKKGDQELAYDPNGNLICKDSFTYTYDPLDRLIQVFSKETLITYTYDAFNRRIARQINGEQELFLYQGQEEIGRWKNGKCQELRLLGKNKQSPTLAIEIEGIPYIPLHDRNGNITTLLTLEGENVEQYRYTAYGEREILSPSGETRPKSALHNPWQYASKRIDEESGLIAFGMRDYDPTLGRWITPDPAGFVDGPNLYAYVHNSPLHYSDSFGLLAESLFGFPGLMYAHCESNYNKFCTPLGMGQSCDPGKESIWHFNLEDKLENAYPKETASPFYRTQTYCANNFTNPQTNQPYQFKEMPPNKHILFINGIGNTFNDFERSLLYIAEIAGFNIQGIFCPTFGKIIDAVCYKHALLDGAAYEGSRELQKHFKNFHANTAEQDSMLVLPHSRGVVYTRNALRDSPQAERKKVQVRAFACGGYIDRHLCKSVFHYESQRDFVPLFDIAGRIRCRDTIITLEPHSKAPWLDHGFTSPTYADAQKFVIKNYMNQ